MIPLIVTIEIFDFKIVVTLVVKCNNITKGEEMCF